MKIPSRVGILLFPEVEVLDFAGPLEVFSTAELPATGERLFQVMTISERAEPIRARHGLTVQPDYSFATVPSLDILIVPGGPGAREREVHNPVLIRWIARVAPELQVVAAVCTGAFLLAKAELLHGKRVTTHWASLARLAQQYPDTTVVPGVRYVDEGHLVTSAGVAAGIDMSLYLVERLCGTEVAAATARRMEYDWQLP